MFNELSQSSKVRTANELWFDISKNLGYKVGNSIIYRICEWLASNGALCTMHASDGIMRKRRIVMTGFITIDTLLGKNSFFLHG